nr:MAG TPA: tail assembly chaperone protein [Caudoviricetes sp.]
MPIRFWSRMQIRRQAALHFCLNLMEISEKSVMCFITVLHPVQQLSLKPMRMRRKYRQRHLPSRQDRWQTDMLRLRRVILLRIQFITTGTRVYTSRQRSLNSSLQNQPRLYLKEEQDMGIRKDIEIDGQMVAFKASAAIPRIYRLKFQRDIYKDLAVLEKSIGDGKEESSNLDMFSLEMFENIAFIMAKHADPSIPDTPEEWLDNFNTFSIYQVLPQLIELWGLNVKTDVESKKKFAQLSVK